MAHSKRLLMQNSHFSFPRLGFLDIQSTHCASVSVSVLWRGSSFPFRKCILLVLKDPLKSVTHVQISEERNHKKRCMFTNSGLRYYHHFFHWPNYIFWIVMWYCSFWLEGSTSINPLNLKILIWKFVSRDVEWRRTWYLEWRDKLDLNDR